MDNLKKRRVKYRLSDPDGFVPDANENETRKNEELLEEKDGWWHSWTQVLEPMAQSNGFLVKAYGLIETKDHDLLELPTRWFRFIDD